MATIRGKFSSITGLTKKVLSPGNREATDYTFQLEPWTVLRVGMFIGHVNPGTLNPSSATALSTNNLRDNFFLGLRTYEPGVFPIENNKPFLGLKSTGATVENQLFNSGSPFFAWTHQTTPLRLGVHHPNGSYDASANTEVNTACDESTATAFCRFLALEFTILNKGLSNQQVTVRRVDGNVVGNPSVSLIKSTLTSATYTNVGTFEFNDSGVPYDIPNSVFFYSPFNFVGTAIHDIVIQKVS